MSGGNIFVYDTVSSAVTGTLASRTVTFDTNKISVYGVQVDSCSDRMYVASRVPSAAGNNIFAFSNASTMNGSYDPDTAGAAQLYHPYAVAIERDDYDRLYVLADSIPQMQQVQIYDDARLMSGVVSALPKTVKGVVSTGYGMATMAY